MCEGDLELSLGQFEGDLVRKRCGDGDISVCCVEAFVAAKEAGFAFYLRERKRA